MKNKPTPSKMLTQGALVLFLAALILSFGSFITGCNGNLTSVENVEPQEDVDFFELTYDPVELAKRPDIAVEETATYQAYISVSEGGVILLDEPEIVTSMVDDMERLDALSGSTETKTLDAFIIQPYSFPYDTSFIFQVTKITTDDGTTPLVFDCQPDGLQFSKPAILLINAWENFGKNCDTVYFYHLNETTSKWELIDQVAVVDGLAATDKITHFSRYGSGSAPKKGAGI